MRVLGSLAFLIGALCVGAYAYFPLNSSHYGRLAEIIHVQVGDTHDVRASTGDAEPSLQRRSFSPGQDTFRSIMDASAKATAHSKSGGKTPMLAGKQTASPPPSSALETSEGFAPASRPQAGWRTVVAGGDSDLRRAAPKRNDYQARYELIQKLQTELARVGCYLGDVDGDWGPGSKRAAGEFLRKVNATLPIDTPDYILLTLIQGHADKACGVYCPSGQGLASDGRCVPNVVVASGPQRGKLLARKTLGARDMKLLSNQTHNVVTPAPALPAPSTRTASRGTAGGYATGASVAGATTFLPDPVTGLANRKADRDSQGAGEPPARAVPLPGMMAVGAPIYEHDSVPNAPAVAALTPPPLPVQSDPGRQIPPARQAVERGASESIANSEFGRSSSAPEIERPRRDASAHKSSKGKEEQRRARYDGRGDTVRTFSGRVRRGSPQHNLMLSLGGVF